MNSLCCIERSQCTQWMSFLLYSFMMFTFERCSLKFSVFYKQWIQTLLSYEILRIVRLKFAFFRWFFFSSFSSFVVLCLVSIRVFLLLLVSYSCWYYCVACATSSIQLCFGIEIAYHINHAYGSHCDRYMVCQLQSCLLRIVIQNIQTERGETIFDFYSFVLFAKCKPASQQQQWSFADEFKFIAKTIIICTYTVLIRIRLQWQIANRFSLNCREFGWVRGTLRVYSNE